MTEWCWFSGPGNQFPQKFILKAYRPQYPGPEPDVPRGLLDTLEQWSSVAGTGTSRMWQ